jgi:hypothetical protein
MAAQAFGSGRSKGPLRQLMPSQADWRLVGRSHLSTITEEPADQGSTQGIVVDLLRCYATPTVRLVKEASGEETSIPWTIRVPAGWPSVAGLAPSSSCSPE